MSGIEPRNTDRTLWAALVLHAFATATSAQADIQVDPETTLADLLADLMHWCNADENGRRAGQPVDFESALARARRHFKAERRRASVK